MTIYGRGEMNIPDYSCCMTFCNSMFMFSLVLNIFLLVFLLIMMFVDYKRVQFAL